MHIKVVYNWGASQPERKQKVKLSQAEIFRVRIGELYK